MSYILGFLISAVVILFQHFLSESRYRLLGGIIPLFVILSALWCFFLRTPRLGMDSLLAFALLFALLVWDWADGRKRFHKKEKEETEAELKKMRAHDIGGDK